MPKVSVIVPNYNHAAFLKQRIDSILNQSFQDFELILLDDCSTDESRAILSSYSSNPHVSHLVFNEKNMGSPFAQWNKGISLAKGEWVWIAESDDWTDEMFLETMLHATLSYPSVGLAFSKARTFNSSSNSISCPSTTGHNTFYSGEQFIYKKLLFENSIYNVGTTIFKRTILNIDEHKKYESMHLCGDWFFYTLICGHTDVLEVDKLMTYYRVHQTNVSSSTESCGLTFLEGIEVLDYIASKYQISQIIYGHYWGKRIGLYKRWYNYSPEVTKQIVNRMGINHNMIVFWYYILEFKRTIISKLLLLRRLIFQ